jgi:uncharacterized protein (DUF427 family)
MLVSTNASVRVLETSHPPTYYLPIVDFAEGVLVPVEGNTFCEFKGVASYFDLAVGDEVVIPQEGDFYGGWITRNIEGPFKGAPGTLGW